MSAGSTPQVRQPAFRALQTSSIGQRLGALWGLHLDQVLHLEPRVPEQSDHVAVGESELDGSVGVGPDEPMHAEMIALQLLGRRQVLVG